MVICIRSRLLLTSVTFLPIAAEWEVRYDYTFHLAGKHIAISTTDRQWFNDAEKKAAIEYWETYQQELFSKIHLRWAYRGSIEFVEGKDFVKLMKNGDNKTN